MEAFPILLIMFYFTIIIIIIPFHVLADTIVVNQTVIDGQTIVSPQETFELGFFSPRNAPRNRYLGIWLKPLPTGMVVWVANRETPIRNKFGELSLHSDGVLVLRDSATNRVIWSSNAITNENARNPVARLLDSGNLMVVADDHTGPESYIWQSFDHPGDTGRLPRMKRGRNMIECLKGFTAKKPNQCQRNIALDCGVGEGFRKYSSMKLPDTRQSWSDRNMTMKQCEAKCRKECNCTAYTTSDIKYGTGCLLWYDELMDMRIFPDSGQDIYIRMAALEIEKDKRVSKSKIKVTFIVIIVVVVVVVVLGLAISLGLSFVIIMKRKLKLKANGRLAPLRQDNVLDLPLFDLSTLLRATNNFSDNNKIGEGGFGPVYKGVLGDGKEVAVKRLSRRSTQGVEEFKNEVIFTSKLQHRNLVKILGCSIQGEEKLLVYEWMPNKGLDLFLFSETEKNSLNWSQRFHIINGVARGLLYLHQDSIMRIIHRDLKPANILLDRDMNPKISDFGIAKSFGGNETQTNTKKVVGTYGYMSPEYARKGIFSVKSDVFSFGVLVLEIVSGKKNRQFFYHAHCHNLLGHAWILYKEGRSLDLVDESLIESLVTWEVLRSIHVALLCVQKSPEDRPDMCMVVMMLRISNQCRLPEPKEPGFFTEEDKFGPESSSRMQTQISNNNVTITHPDPR